MKSILVTGGAGFIGSHLVDALVDKYPDYKIVSIDDYSNGKEENHNSNAIYVELDIRSSDLKTVFEKYQPEYVFHFAAQVDLRFSVEDPLYDIEVNVLGAVNVLENARKFNVKKFIFSSSGGAVYSSDVMPAHEESPAIPISPYGINKLSIDLYLNYYHQVWGMQYVSLRFANVYGPRQRGGVVPIFVRKFLAGEQPMQNGDGSQTRDYLYVKDAVSASLLAVESDKNGLYTVGTSIETSLKEMIEVIKREGGFEQEVAIGPAKEGEIMQSVLLADKFKNEFGWKHEYSVADGVKETIDFARSNL